LHAITASDGVESAHESSSSAPGTSGRSRPAMLASFGHEVLAVDSDAEKIDLLRRGKLPFFEPGLQELGDERVATGRLSFEYENKAALPGAEVVMICVGTAAKQDGAINVAAVERAASDLARDATAPSFWASRLCRRAPTIGSGRRSTASAPPPDSTSCPTPSSFARSHAFTIPSSPTESWSDRTPPRVRCDAATRRAAARVRRMKQVKE
jgi:UDP-glucose/GDP-mannose dehydrogenase family, NAD binding domain